MTNEQVAAELRKSMEVLHWELRDLVINAFVYGHAGNEGDIGEHLRTGNHLSPAESSVINAARIGLQRTMQTP